MQYMSYSTACCAGSELQLWDVIWHSMAALQQEQDSSDIINSNRWHCLQSYQPSSTADKWHVLFMVLKSSSSSMRSSNPFLGCLEAETVINLWWHATFHYTALSMLYTVNSHKAAALHCNWIFFSTPLCCVTLSLKHTVLPPLDTHKTQSM